MAVDRPQITHKGSATTDRIHHPTITLSNMPPPSPAALQQSQGGCGEVVSTGVGQNMYAAIEGRTVGWYWLFHSAIVSPTQLIIRQAKCDYSVPCER